MLPKLSVYLDSSISNSHVRTDRFFIEDGGKKIGNLYFRISNAENIGLQKSLNPAAIGLVNYGMSRGRHIHLHGPVSKILLENLEEFQCAWTLWRRHYKKIDITADCETIENHVPQSQSAICTFSCGVDAAFSIWRHYFKKAGRHHKELKSAVLVQGFDIAEDDSLGIEEMTRNAESFLKEVAVKIHLVKTNIRREWLPEWEMNFGCGCAAVLHLFSGSHSYGIIGGDEPYNQLVIPWGSNPITNHLLSSQRFNILYDGNGYTRTEKVEHIAQWAAARENLRVCWEGPRRGYNCGYCEKCCRTKLNFLASGVGIPPCFSQGISTEEIGKIAIPNPVVRAFYAEIANTAKKRGIVDPWVKAVENLL